MKVLGHLFVNRRRRWGRRYAQIGFLLLLSGCDSGLAKVHGSVSLDGKKLAGASDIRGTLLFSPLQPGHPTGSGMLDSNGTYAVFVGSNQGLTPGSYKVAITVTKVLPAKTPGGAPSGRLLTPSRYANPGESGLEVEVVPGTNTFDFALKSDHNS